MTSVVTVSHWPRSVGFGSVLRKKPRFRFSGRFSGSAVVNGCLAVSSKPVISMQYWSTGRRLLIDVTLRGR